MININWVRLPRGVKAAKVYLSKFYGSTFKSYTEKNNRGDYGYDEIFSVDNVPVYKISIDGAHQDTQHFGV